MAKAGRNLSYCTPDMIYFNLTFTSPEDSQYILYTKTEEILIAVILPILLIIGVSLNSSFLFVFARIQRMRTVTNIYLANLAISDTCFLCMAILEKVGRFTASNIKVDQYGFGSALWCEVIQCSVECFFYASIFLVLLVTMEKYYAICRPVQHRLLRGRSRTVRLTTTSWLVAVLFGYGFSIPYFMYFDYVCLEFPDYPEYADSYNVIGVCYGDSFVLQAVFNGVRTIPFFVAMILNFIMYVKIIRVFQMRVGAQEQRQHSSAHAQRIKTRNQVARMLIVNGVLFFFLLSPYQFMRISIMISELSGKYLLDSQQFIAVQWVFRILTYINSMINPLIYNIMNGRYRRASAEAFNCCPERKKSHLDQTENTIEETIEM